MRLKLDENITGAAKRLFLEAGHQVETVGDEGLIAAVDDDLIDVCRREQRMLVTFDLGFGDVRSHEPGTHAGVILLRLGDQQRAVVLDVLGRLLEQQRIDTFQGALVVVTEDRVRMRR